MTLKKPYGLAGAFGTETYWQTLICVIPFPGSGLWRNETLAEPRAGKFPGEIFKLWRLNTHQHTCVHTTHMCTQAHTRAMCQAAWHPRGNMGCEVKRTPGSITH